MAMSNPEAALRFAAAVDVILRDRPSQPPKQTVALIARAYGRPGADDFDGARAERSLQELRERFAAELGEPEGGGADAVR